MNIIAETKWGVWHKAHSDDQKAYVGQMKQRAKAEKEEIGFLETDYQCSWYYRGQLFAKSVKLETGWIHQMRKLK